MLREAVRTVVPSLVLSLLMGSAVQAQVAGDVDVDPSVVSVVTGGQWSEGPRSGHFRVVVRQLGWDHVVTEVHLQWVSPDVATQSLEIVRSELVFDPNTDGTWSFGRPTFQEAQGSRVRVSVEGTHTYSLEDGHLTFEAGALDEDVVVLESPGGGSAPHVS